MAAKYEAQLEQIADELRRFIVSAVQKVIESAGTHGIDGGASRHCHCRRRESNSLVLEAMYQRTDICQPLRSGFRPKTSIRRHYWGVHSAGLDPVERSNKSNRLAFGLSWCPRVRRWKRLV